MLDLFKTFLMVQLVCVLLKQTLTVSFLCLNVQVINPMWTCYGSALVLKFLLFAWSPSFQFLTVRIYLSCMELLKTLSWLLSAWSLTLSSRYCQVFHFSLTDFGGHDIAARWKKKEVISQIEESIYWTKVKLITKETVKVLCWIKRNTPRKRKTKTFKDLYILSNDLIIELIYSHILWIMQIYLYQSIFRFINTIKK